MRRGRQEPTFERVGIYDHSDGPDAVSLFEGYGVRFIPAQSYEMELYLAKNELGESEAITIGLSRPRQNGKSFAARYYALWCAFVEGKSVLYSAHNGSTTRKMFKFMCDFIEGHGDFHRKLKPSGQGVYKAQGSEGIFLADGTVIEFSTRTNSGARGGTYDVIVVDEAQELTDEQRDAMMPTTIALADGTVIEFSTRTNSGARGGTYDVIVVDEAQELTDEQRDAMMPTTIASESGDPQMIYIGTPPNPKCPGTVFRDLHDRAHADELGDAWWLEWAAKEIGDPQDAGRWCECNPMMGYRIKERAMRNAADTTAPDSFAREYLGWWDSSAGSVQRVISREDWDACRTDAPPESGLMGVGVKFAPDGSRVALAVCLKPGDGKPYVEVVRAASTSRGTRWVAEWLEARRDKVASVAVDGKRGESTVQALADAHFPRKAVHVLGSADVAKACAMLVDAVQSGAVEHYGQPDLDAAATTCARRRIGMDGFGFDDTETGDSTLIEACALAYREAMTTKRRPGRKAVVY